MIETNGQALIEAIRPTPGRKHLGIEEGRQSACLYEILEPHVHELIVTTMPKSRGQKGDKADAYQRAEELLRGGIGSSSAFLGRTAIADGGVFR